VTESTNKDEAPSPRPPVDLDITVAHPARVYDYWLGGKDNFAADREAAEQAIEANPMILPGVRTNRAFLRRAVSYLAGEAGVVQTHRWRPGPGDLSSDQEITGWCGVARKS